VIARLRIVLLSLSFLIGFGGSFPVLAFTSEDANTIVDAYNKVFYVRAGSNAHYADTQTGGITYFWKQIEEVEGMLDAYDRTGDLDYKDKEIKLLNGFVDNNGANWSKNSFNDDIMWACIAFARGYLNTGNSRFKAIAKANFDIVYGRAWDSNLEGGLWWTTEKTTKNACVNGPGSIAAYLIYMCTADPDYLTKATDMYNWERAHLFNSSNGQIYDAMSAKGVVSTWPSTYNQGTFVGAANYLGKIDDAVLATNYTMNQMGDARPNGYRIMPDYDIDGNNSGFNGIGVRWMAKFMMDNKLQDSYLKWLQENANAAWKVRRPSDNLSWCKWPKPTSDKTVFHSWDCSSSVVILQVVPPDQTVPLDQVPSTNQDTPGDQTAPAKQDAPTDQVPATNQP
jgi:predicted alpha-1,6-mannanase (GH76 family)